jgi:P pilus assembly chaperone PapD
MNKLRRHLTTTSQIVFALLLSQMAFADIFVDRAIVRLSADAPPREDVKVINNGDQEGFVQVDVFEVHNPGTDKEERVKVTDPAAVKLIASPSKLAIPPNGQKLVRIVNLDPSSTEERIYRINVTPVLPPLQEESGSVVRVVVAYQLLVIVDPAAPREDLEIKRSGFKLSVKNNGNTNVLISDGQQCDQASDHCVDIAAHRVYPGNSWETELVLDSPVTFKLTSFNGIREVSTE